MIGRNVFSVLLHRLYSEANFMASVGGWWSVNFREDGLNLDGGQPVPDEQKLSLVAKLRYFLLQVLRNQYFGQEPHH
jgi:hypothetical protein